MLKQKEITEVLDRLKDRYPEAGCALDHVNVFQLLIAVVLSAQTTDKSVNIVSVPLFEAYPDLRQKLWKGQLWNHSYYVETVGSVSEDAIRKYIGNQSKSY